MKSQKRRVFLSGIIVILMMMLGVIGCGVDSVETVGESYESYKATIDGKTYTLEYRLLRPLDSLPHPLIILTHGRDGAHPKRDAWYVKGYGNLCSALAYNGYVVMMLVRRGYGNSGGPDSELKDTPYASGLEAAKDLLSAVGHMKTQPYVDPTRIVVMGQSQGGFAAIAFSTLKVDGVLGTVNISGGINYTSIDADPHSTRYLKWASDCGEYGKINTLPTLWIYSKNDWSIPPIASEPMFKSFQNAGGKGTFIMKPEWRGDGHGFCDDPGFFMGDLLSFFSTIGMAEQ
ncbi:MAG: alpha/beta fold hydrolase [Fibrobacter sp.]|nr:alpha/beta fold hydrolase [Fibrobacter sp.]